MHGIKEMVTLLQLDVRKKNYPGDYAVKVQNGKDLWEAVLWKVSNDYIQGIDNMPRISLQWQFLYTYL